LNKYDSIPPQRLYLPAVLVDFAPLIAVKPKFQDKYKFFLHTLYLQRILTGAERHEYVEINNKYFEKHVTGDHAQSIKNFWIHHKVIECNGSYQVGVSSKGYRFTKVYQDEKVMDAKYLDKGFERKVYKVRQETKNGKIDLKVKQHAFLNFCLQDLRINAASAQLRLNQTLYAAKGTKAQRAKLFDKVNLNTIAINAIKDREFRMSRDVTGRRVHTNITNFMSLIRQDLYLETGEELMNLDVPNSQPLLLCVLLLDHFSNDVPTDVLNYIQACEKGEIYETIMLKMGLNPLDKAARKKFKNRMFKCVFYGQNKNAENYEEWKAFRSLYKGVADFITEQKKVDYKSLSHRMQRAESALIIDDVIRTIAENHSPEYFFATTIHDSIICTRDNTEYVCGLMIEAFKKVGLNVRIVPEPLRPDTEPTLVEAALDIKFVPAFSQAELFEQSMNMVQDGDMFEELDLLACQVPIEPLPEFKLIHTHSLKPDFYLLSDKKRIEQIERDLVALEASGYQFDPVLGF
jgi:hypothetical protein